MPTVIAAAPPAGKRASRRFWLLSAGFTVLAGLTAAMAGIWVHRQRDAQALGFEGYFERLNAAKAGFVDPAKFRDWETAQRVAAETARRAKEVADRPLLACTAAQYAIKQRLVSSSAAKFPFCGDWPGHVRADGPSSWVVTSWVDIPDASGIIRQRGYQVSVTREGSGDWRTFILRMP